MSDIAYNRLPGTRRGMIRRASAWLAPDHILLVGGSRFHETYKRVYLRDIQALLVMKKTRFVVQVPSLLIPLGLLFAGFFLPSGWRSTGWLGVGLLEMGFLFYLYISALTNGCRFYLATAVGNVEVGSVFRGRQARRFSERIRPLILEAQRQE